MTKSFHSKHHCTSFQCCLTSTREERRRTIIKIRPVATLQQKQMHSSPAAKNTHVYTQYVCCLSLQRKSYPHLNPCQQTLAALFITLHNIKVLIYLQCSSILTSCKNVNFYLRVVPDEIRLDIFIIFL